MHRGKINWFCHRCEGPSTIPHDSGIQISTLCLSNQGLVEIVHKCLGIEFPRHKRNQRICYLCNKKGHYANSCPEKKSIQGSVRSQTREFVTWSVCDRFKPCL
jgi:hypothetical protein